MCAKKNNCVFVMSRSEILEVKCASRPRQLYNFSEEKSKFVEDSYILTHPYNSVIRRKECYIEIAIN